VQFYLRLLLDASAAGRIALERVVEATSTAPARIFGLEQKGRLAAGYDADIAIVDLDSEAEITDDEVLSKCGWTPYAGRLTRGTVTTTLARGEVIYRDGTVVGRPGRGRHARPVRRTAA
jgi:dihydroorotase